MRFQLSKNGSFLVTCIRVSWHAARCALTKPVDTSGTKMAQRCCKTRLRIRFSLLTNGPSRWSLSACCTAAFCKEASFFLFSLLYVSRMMLLRTLNVNNKFHVKLLRFRKSTQLYHFKDSLYVLFALLFAAFASSFLVLRFRSFYVLVCHRFFLCKLLRRTLKLAFCDKDGALNLSGIAQ